MADYDWFDRSPSKDELAARKYRPLGFHPVWDSGVNRVQYYRCHRGCGTLVWNPEEHMKNVCPTFEPVAGEPV